MRRTVATLSMLAGLSVSIEGATPENIRGSYLVDPRPIGQTPKHLGVCLEITDYQDRANVWDWLADSGASMARIVHPDKDLRLIPASEDTYKGIESRADFEAFRARLLADPEKNIPWQNYAFDQVVPWLGVPDRQVEKTTESGVKPMISIAYASHYYPRPPLKKYTDDFQPPDENIDWGAAASAYEYYLAVIYRHATRDGATYYMMLNEPDGTNPKYIKEIGVIARMGRLALEDVRAKLTDQQVAAGLRLSGPACHYPWEEFWPYVAPYVDFLDFHFYDPDPEMFKRQYNRMVLRSRELGKKVAVTEFNRIGGPLQPDEALFSVRPSLQVGGLVMSVLGSSRAQDPGCELALFYEFQAPATHRSFKSLVYGDMNLLDWTGQDKQLWAKATEWYPSFDELQLRFATPAYHIFKMLSRCAPGAGDVESYEVLDLGESSKGMGHTHDPVIRHNVYQMLSEPKYTSLGGVGPELRMLVVRSPERLYISILNPGPRGAKQVGFNLELLKEQYVTAVVRETSLIRRDEVVAQMPVTNTMVVVDIPQESLTQIILVKDDLTKVTELKLEETTTTPGTIKELELFQTTRLRAMGRLNDRWLDLTDLNVVWKSSDADLVNVYQGGLVQRVRSTGKQVAIAARTFNGSASAALVVPPDLEAEKLEPIRPLVTNGGFEQTWSESLDVARDWTYRNETRWTTGLSPAQGWIASGSKTQWTGSKEQNHTPGGSVSMKLQVEGNVSSEATLAPVTHWRNGAELTHRRYRFSLWVYRPIEGALTSGKISFQVKYDTDPEKDKHREIAARDLAEIPVGQWTQMEHEISVPDTAARITAKVSISGEPKLGVVYVDDVSIEGE